VAIGNGERAIVAWNGSELREGRQGQSGTGTFTNLTVTGTASVTGATTLSSTLTLSSGTANGVAYLNGSNVLTTGSALTFDALSLFIGNGTANSALYFNTVAGGAIVGKIGGTNTWLIGDTSAALGSGTGFINYNYGSTPWIWYMQTGAEQMRLTSTGLGIGTSSPGAKLHVIGSIRQQNAVDGTDTIKLINAAGGVLADLYGFGTSYFTVQSGANIPIIYNSQGASGLHRWQNNSSDVMRLDASGNLGLGTVPSAWGTLYKGLQVTTGASLWSTNNGGAYLSSNVYFDGASRRFIYNGTALEYNMSSGAHVWYNGATGGIAGNPISFIQAMTLDASGNLGIGTASPVYKLDVKTSLGSIGVSSSGSVGTAVFFRNTSGTTTATIANNGGSNELLQYDVGGTGGGHLFNTNGVVKNAP
jgi:hypothetical protein